MYRQTGEDVLSLEVLRNRWKLFGHVLRSHPETPAQKAMNYYFEKSNAKKFRGRPVITLPVCLHNDIIMLKKHNTFKNRYSSITQFKSIHDLKSLRTLAQERQTWTAPINDIYVAAKAEKS